MFITAIAEKAVGSSVEKAIVNMIANKKGWTTFSKGQKADVFVFGVLLTLCLVGTIYFSDEINSIYKSVA